MAELSTEQQELLNRFDAARSQYVLFTDSLVPLVQRLSAALSISAEVTGRTKDVSSFKEKVTRKGYTDLVQVPDLSGIRVIVPYKEDVDQVCEMLGQEFTVVEEVAHEYDRPEAFGYASRHLIVELSNERANLREWSNLSGSRCEIQVRTILQHAWATISHSLDYKGEADAPGDVRRKLFQVAALIEVGDTLFQDFRRDLDLVKEEYSTSTRSDMWKSLPINVDSLRATVRHWLPTDFADNMREQGFRLVDMEEVRDTQGNLILSSIVELTQLLGIQTVGALSVNLRDNSWREQFLVQVGADQSLYSLDYVALLMLYLEARNRGVKLPPSVNEAWHARSLRDETTGGMAE